VGIGLKSLKENNRREEKEKGKKEGGGKEGRRVKCPRGEEYKYGARQRRCSGMPTVFLQKIITRGTDGVGDIRRPGQDSGDLCRSPKPFAAVSAPRNPGGKGRHGGPIS
jgi:hypothetical protein